MGLINEGNDAELYDKDCSGIIMKFIQTRFTIALTFPLLFLYDFCTLLIKHFYCVSHAVMSTGGGRFDHDGPVPD